MKSEGSIRHKAKQVRYRYLKKELEDSLSPCASHCVHNRRLLLPDGEEVGVCGFSWKKGEWPGICDEQYHDYSTDYPGTSCGCPHFQIGSTKDEVKESFNTWLEDATIPEIAARYPDLAALLWVLGEESESSLEGPDPFVETFPVSLGSTEVHLVSEQDREVLADFLVDTCQKCLTLQEVVRDLKESHDNLVQVYDKTAADRDKLQESVQKLERLQQERAPWYKRLWGVFFE